MYPYSIFLWNSRTAQNSKQLEALNIFRFEKIEFLDIYSFISFLDRISFDFTAFPRGNIVGLLNGKTSVRTLYQCEQGSTFIYSSSFVKKLKCEL